MDLNKLTWCKKIDKGYELIEPNKEINIIRDKIKKLDNLPNQNN